MKLEKNKTYEFSLKGRTSFGSISESRMYDLLKDGRLASFFLEEQLQHWFPELTRIEGNKDHDHVDTSGNKYDAKNFTKNGLKFKPSNQLGQGRTFNAEIAHNKARKLCYICCDIVEFPRVRVKFVDGADLINEYPKCEIPKGQREVLFG
tara:strand:+ start:951 stop:1400 length:450 start_codon:yes stop_codon:yes gene_type:complete